MVQSILGQLRCPKGRQLERCGMSFVRVHQRGVVSVNGVLGLRYARNTINGSELFRSSQAMRLANKGSGCGISSGRTLDIS